MSNAEHNWWVEDSKHMKWPTRPTTDFADYLEKVTKPEYKPPLSTVLEKKEKYHFRWDRFKTLAFYSLMVPTIIMASRIPMFTKPPALYDVYRLMKASFEEVNDNFGHLGAEIKDVIDRRSAAAFLTETMAYADTVWPNEKYVRNVKIFGGNESSIITERAGKGRSFMLLGSTKIIFLFLSHEWEAVILEEFEPFFIHSYQFVDEAGLLIKPVVFFDKTFFFDATSSGSFDGASRETYPNTGHVMYIRADPWLSYYAELRRIIDFSLFSEKLLLRAGVFSTNYLCPNIPSITTVDFIIEVLPSGVCTAKMQVESAVVFTPDFPALRNTWTFLAVVALLLGITNVHHFCEVGLYSNRTFQSRLRICLWLWCFIFAAFGAVTRLTKHRLMRDVVEGADLESYNDFHGIYNDEQLDDLICGMVVFVGVAELVTRLAGIFDMDRFKLAFLSVSRLTAALVLILLYICGNYHSTNLKLRYKHPRGLFFYLTLKEMYPTIPENDYQPKQMTLIAVLIVAIAARCCAAFTIYRYLKVKKDKLEIRNAIITERYVWKIRGMQWLTDLKKSNFIPVKVVFVENARSPITSSK